MQERDMEDIFRQKLEDFEASHNDRWEQIQAALPPEKTKRRAFWLWFSGAALVIVSAGALFLTMPDKQESAELGKNISLISQEESTNNASRHGADPEIQDDQESKEIHPISPGVTNGAEDPAAKKGESLNSQRRLQPSPQTPTKEDTEQTNNERKEPTLQELPVEENELPLLAPNPNLPEETSKNPIDSNQTPTNDLTGGPIVKNPLPEKSEKGAQKKSPEKSTETTPKFSFGIGLGVYATRFEQRLPKNPGTSALAQSGILDKNLDLREKSERIGESFTQNMWMQYQITPAFGIATGITLMQSNQYASYNLIGPSKDLFKAPDDFSEGQIFIGVNDYLFPTDS
ncbi:MAG: hypothetical protein LPK45_02375, partial [Bacteroidota bacterium]|nr:hypothetical protein [Bacteroidota bacterium]MDX5429884.1 hypothetical protein [Bacteroidota bacterium]MDX5468658.1 hypothetical protein [Bacteroidota bacterium]